MNATPAARRVAFAAIVCGFAALGGYLLGPAAHHGRTPSQPAAAPRSPRPAASAAHRAVGASSAAPDIYQWLPFTQSGLAAAAATAIRFGDAYGTYTYTEDPGEYAASLQPVASAQLVGQIEAAYSAPGVAAARQSQQQVAVSTAAIGSLRAFGPGSLTFVLQVTQQVTGTAGESEQVAAYAVTVSGAGTSWQVTDVELAAAGNS